MNAVSAKGRVRSTSIRAVVTRADGRVESLGLISYWSRNPLKRWAVNLYIWIKKGFKP